MFFRSSSDSDNLEVEEVVEGKGGSKIDAEDAKAEPASLSLTPDIVKGRGEERQEEEDTSPPPLLTSSSGSHLPDMLVHTPHSLERPEARLV